MTSRATGLFATRTAAFVALGIALAAQIAWVAWFLLGGHGAPSSLTRPLIFSAPFLALALTKGRIRGVAGISRMMVGCAFLLALSSRFGHFTNFIKYAGTVLAFLPAAIIPTLAVMATICECVLCVLMLLGIQTRWACAGSAILLFLFATAMTISRLSQFEWAVYVLSFGSWALATVDASMPGLEAMAGSRKN
jgi:uncharacterized membrane protein YphA (DoxX/SURF4 family)